MIIYIINVLAYLIFVFAKKIKRRYELLGTLAVAFSIFAATTDIRRPARLLEIGHFFAIAFLAAMMMFAVFTLLTVLLDKYTEMRELAKISISFGSSLILGSVLSYAVWWVLVV